MWKECKGKAEVWCEQPKRKDSQPNNFFWQYYSYGIKRQSYSYYGVITTFESKWFEFRRILKRIIDSSLQPG